MESYQNELTTARASLQSFDRDHQENVGTLLKKETEIDRLNGVLSFQNEWHVTEGLLHSHPCTLPTPEENKDLNGRLQASKSELTKSESIIFDLQSSERNSKFQVTKLEQELSLLKQQNEWLTNEQKAHASEYQQYRQEKVCRRLPLKW